MNVLVLGGTRFIGRHIVDQFVTCGHDVSVFTRGKSPDDLPPDVERLQGDRDDAARGFTALRNRRWDACIDVSGYTPKQVRPSAELLRDAVRHYLFISSVSVYQDRPGPLLEKHPLLDAAAESVTEITAETYGPLKVTCERIVQEVYGERAAILRPQIVAGPRDPTGRHTYWVQRATQGGAMLAPGDGSDHLQVVDVRDLARFVRQLIEHRVGGTFNIAGPRLTWSEFMTPLRARDVIWVNAEIIAAAGLTFMELPLFRPDGSEHSGFMHVSSARAAAQGFTVTEPRATADDVRAWLAEHPVTPALSPDRERSLIATARAAQT